MQFSVAGYVYIRYFIKIIINKIIKKYIKYYLNYFRKCVLIEGKTKPLFDPSPFAIKVMGIIFFQNVMILFLGGIF